MPADWNGTLILYGHGLRGPGENPAWDQTNEDALNVFAELGYAVTASSYSTTSWTLATAQEDQLYALDQFRSQESEPARVIAVGESMGGLVTGLLAERGDVGIDGAVPVCGVMEGGVDRMNYQLDAAFAAAVLLVDDPDLRLTGFLTPGESAETVGRLQTALTEVPESSAGRARLTLVGALLNIPQDISGVDSEDPAALADAQAPLIAEVLTAVTYRRSGIVSSAGGDSGWTQGVDYAALVQESSHLPAVEAHYAASDVELHSDLARLNAEADLAPDQAALSWMRENSQPSGDLQVPVLTLHTMFDLRAPVEVESAYRKVVGGTGRAHLLEQVYVRREGHCAFSPAEQAVAVEVMDERLNTGRWPQTSAESLNARAEELELDDSEFADFTPPEFVNTRRWP